VTELFETDPVEPELDEPELIAIELAGEAAPGYVAAVVPLLLLEAEAVHRACRISRQAGFESHTSDRSSR